MKEAFKHDFKSTDIEEIIGFMKCMSAVMDHIKKETGGYNIEKRFIDSIPLVAKIRATTHEFNVLRGLAQDNLDSVIDSIIKQ